MDQPFCLIRLIEIANEWNLADAPLGAPLQSQI